METRRVTVRAERPYSVLLGRALLSELPESLDLRTRQVLLIYPNALATSAAPIRERLESRGLRVLEAEVPNGEDAKRIEVASFCWTVMGQADFNRTDAVIAIGGGATTDLGGFVAASWMRGVDCVLVPTTLLGMVDAAIGGKTAINTTEGKNLVGAFFNPRAVVADLDSLATLPHFDVLSGLAEVIKYGFIRDPSILDDIEREPDAAVDPSSELFASLVERSMAIKAEIVASDFRESGLREILNYGHTLGHAIEHAERYQWRHGAAISIGMVFAAELSRLTGTLSDADVSRHRAIFERLGLPIAYRANAWNQLLSTMQRDKKAASGALRFITLEGIGRPTVLTAPAIEIVHAAYQEISE